MLYTRKGDNGRSGLFGTKGRFLKSNPIYEALGTVDELNSLLGMCRAGSGPVKHRINLANMIYVAQKCLFMIQAEIAGAGQSITQIQINELEGSIGHLENFIKKSGTFVIAGATNFSALCDYARAVSRRTERTVLIIGESRGLSQESLTYLNRLSSFLYAVARYSAGVAGMKESAPNYGK